MPRLTLLLPLALATLSVAALQAKAEPAGQTTYPNDTPAPIIRSDPPPRPRYWSDRERYRGNYDATLATGQVLRAVNGTANAQPISGVYLRVAMNSAVREVASTPERAEFRIEHGVANISVHHPKDGILLLVDLPGGQVQMLKNGLYTFNAFTDTARVLKGEAKAFGNGAAADAKAPKVKENHAITFPAPGSTVAKLESREFAPFQARNDVIPQPYRVAQLSDGAPYGNDPGSRSYGDAPDYGWGSPYGYGYGPYWDGFYGYPFGFGLGFGYGGFYGGGRFGGFRR